MTCISVDGLTLSGALLLSVSFSAFAESGLAKERCDRKTVSGRNDRGLGGLRSFARITGGGVTSLRACLLGVYDHIKGAEHWYTTPYIYGPLLCL